MRNFAYFCHYGIAKAIGSIYICNGNIKRLFSYG